MIKCPPGFLLVDKTWCPLLTITISWLSAHWSPTTSGQLPLKRCTPLVWKYVFCCMYFSFLTTICQPPRNELVTPQVENQQFNTHVRREENQSIFVSIITRYMRVQQPTSYKCNIALHSYPPFRQLLLRIRHPKNCILKFIFQKTST